MPKCKNPECRKDVPDGRSYCDDHCANRHIELMRAKLQKRTEARAGDPAIEDILEYIGVTPETVRHDAYEHWRRFIQFLKDRSPASWRNDLRPKLRSWIGVDFRYIDSYFSACLSWGIIELNNGVLHFKGIPKGDQPSPIKHGKESAE
ncbi:MAG: hypothetical protein H3Z52_12455 [archaeon]|nr:hypothetical protein [archaeon]